jgi:hypothetical protein
MYYMSNILDICEEVLYPNPIMEFIVFGKGALSNMSTMINI